MNSPLNISPTFIFLTFPGHFGGALVWKLPRSSHTFLRYLRSSGCHFGRCFPKVSSFSPDSSISWPLGQRLEYLRSQRHGAAHWLPRNKCLSCVKWLAFFHSRGWNTPHPRWQNSTRSDFGVLWSVKNSQSHLTVWTTIQWSNGLVESFKDQVAVWNGLGSEGTSLLQSVLVFQSPRGCWLSDIPSPQIACHVGLAPQPLYTSLKQWSLSRGMIDMNQLLGPSDRNCLSASPSLLCRPARSCKCKQHMETKSKVKTSPFCRCFFI